MTKLKYFLFNALAGWIGLLIISFFGKVISVNVFTGAASSLFGVWGLFLMGGICFFYKSIQCFCAQATKNEK